MRCRWSMLHRLRLPSTTVLHGCWLVCILLAISPAHALDPNKRLTQYAHVSWRTQDGSLPAGMFSITQTSDGFLWFLSLPGDIYRFDGVRFVAWPLTLGPVGKLIADRADGLWIVANELVHQKSGVVTAHFALKGLHAFQSVSEGPDGSLWVGLRAADKPLCRVTDLEVTCFGKDDGITLPGVLSLISDGSGGFWLGGDNALVHWKHGVSESYSVKASVQALAHGRDGTLWVGINEEGVGLQQLRQGALVPFVVPGFDGSKLSVTSLMFDRDLNLWVGSASQGVFRIRENSVEHYGRAEGLSGDSVWELFEDREGIVWAGSTTGVDSFRDPRVVTFSSAQGLGKDLAAGILAGNDGSIWVANDGSLDRIKNGIVSSIRRSNGLPGAQVASMLQDHAGNLWVGVDDGLYLFKDERFRRLPEPDHKPLGMVVGITEDIDGNVWAECASKPRKLVRIRDFQIRESFVSPQVPAGHNLAADPHGGIWIEGRDGDINLFRDGAVQAKIPIARAGSPLNRQIAPQADGSVLVGSENGLVGWRAGKMHTLTTKNGLPCDFIIAFVQDTAKRWWLYTRCGVVEISDAELRRWWTDPGAIVQNRLYDAFDGAQPNIGSFNAAAATADGRVWFSSGVVVQMVDPSRLSQPPAAAASFIEAVIVNRKQMALSDKLKIPPRPRDLQIDYTSPTFTIPQRVKFRYRLDGFDTDWHDAGTRRQAFYTDLPPGNYSFRVVASNSDGIWSESAATLAFSVVPAYYQTTWFRAVCVFAFVTLLWAAYQWRVRQMGHQFELTLNARVGERTRIARDLHDTLLQSFHGLLLRFQTASNLLPAQPVNAKQVLDGAIDQAADAIAESRDAVQGLRDSTIQRNDLALAIRTLGEELATQCTSDRPEFRVAVEGEPRDLHPIVRDEIYKIAGESLRNAFRHAQASRVEVELRYDNEQFRLRLRDDGKGIDPAVLAHDSVEGHFGLHGMRERALVIGGKLAVWSELHAGTEVELAVPATSAYANARRQSWLARKFAARA